MNKKQEDRLWVLLAKQHSGEASMDELSELQEILDAERISANIEEKLRTIWETPLKNVAADTRITSLQLKQKIDRKKAVQQLIVRWSVAAASIVIVAVSLLVFNLTFFKQHQDIAMQQQGMHRDGTITSGGLSKTKNVLADGSVVWLHHDSRISYDPSTFGKQNREIELVGEAFFEVARNEQIPFTVNAGGVVVQVKGTTFNVKAYPGNATVETVLVSGMVEVYDRKNPGRKVTLQPNDKMVIPILQDQGWEYRISRLEKNNDQPLDETVWVASALSFDNESLETLAPKLESWYNITIRFSDDHVKQLRFSAIIVDETLDQTLEAMRLSYPFDYQLKKGVLWIGKDSTDREMLK